MEATEARYRMQQYAYPLLGPGEARMQRCAYSFCSPGLGGCELEEDLESGEAWNVGMLLSGKIGRMTFLVTRL